MVDGLEVMVQLFYFIDREKSNVHPFHETAKQMFRFSDIPKIGECNSFTGGDSQLHGTFY